MTKDQNTLHIFWCGHERNRKFKHLYYKTMTATSISTIALCCSPRATPVLESNSSEGDWFRSPSRAARGVRLQLARTAPPHTSAQAPSPTEWCQSTSQEPASVAEYQTAKVSCFSYYPAHTAPDPLASHRWWARQKGDPHRLFRLCPTGLHGYRPGHQALAAYGDLLPMVTCIRARENVLQMCCSSWSGPGVLWAVLCLGKQKISGSRSATGSLWRRIEGS